MQPSPVDDHPLLEPLRSRLPRGRPGLLLDFDGTLAELVARPEDGRLLAASQAALARLLARGVPIGIVSGRTCDDLRARVPLDGVWLSGVHGAELVAPGAARLSARATPDLRDALEAFSAAARELEPWGLRLEDKRLAVAAHVRPIASPERQREALSRLRTAAQAVAARWPDVSWFEGKAVVELRSRHASKANAARMLLHRWPAGTSLLAVGDDTTDEDMFLEALGAGGTAVKVGDGPTAAPLRLRDPADVAALLEALARAPWSADRDRLAPDR